MLGHLTRSACVATTISVKNSYGHAEPQQSPAASMLSLEKCLPERLGMPTVNAAGGPCPDPAYVGDRIKKTVGFPQLTACCKPLRYKDFIISYDTKNRIPNWVYEHLQYHKFFKDDPCDRRIALCPYK